MADALDVLSLTEGKAALNIASSVTEYDTELAQAITAVSRLIDDVCGPVISRAVTENHNGGCSTLRLRNTPVASVTSVTEYDNTTATALTAETNATKPTAGYLLDDDGDENPHGVRIIRRNANYDYWFPAGRRNVVVVYQAGRGATADPRFKAATVELLQSLWLRRGSGPQTAVPSGDGLVIFGATWSRKVLMDDIRLLLPVDARLPGIG